MNIQTTTQHRERLILLYLLIFLVPYFAATTVFQLRWDQPVHTEGSPFDRMNGGLLWLASVMALMNAVLRGEDLRRSALWLLGTAAIAVVALDELFALHEYSERVTGDDDHPKLVLLLCACVAVYVLNKLEKLHHIALLLIIGGLSAHFVYLFVEFGDGDFFELPLSKVTLRWIEEYMELTASGFYFSGLFFQGVMTFHVPEADNIDD